MTFDEYERKARRELMRSLAQVAVWSPTRVRRGQESRKERGRRQAIDRYLLEVLCAAAVDPKGMRNARRALVVLKHLEVEL